MTPRKKFSSFSFLIGPPPLIHYDFGCKLFKCVVYVNCWNWGNLWNVIYLKIDDNWSIQFHLLIKTENIHTFVFKIFYINKASREFRVL